MTNGVESTECAKEESQDKLTDEIAKYFSGVFDFMEECSHRSFHMDSKEIVSQWFPSSSGKKKFVGEEYRRKKLAFLDSLPNNRGRCETKMKPFPSHCFPFSLDLTNEWRLTYSNSAFYSRAPPREFASSRHKRQRVDKRLFHRPHNWMFVPRRILEQSKHWTEYKRKVSRWSGSVETNGLTDHLWDYHSDQTPLITPGELIRSSESNILNKLQMVQAGCPDWNRAKQK